MEIKMKTLMLCTGFIYAFLVSSAKCEFNETSDISEHYKTLDWMKSAQNMLVGPAGQMVVQVAKELVKRSTGTSQVLSLNLSNFIILILLKALIFTAGAIGAGHWTHGIYERRRSHESENSIFDDGEPQLFMGYLHYEGTGNKYCLEKAACQSPTTAMEYVRAARALLNGVNSFVDLADQKINYQYLINSMEAAAYTGYRGVPCELMENKCPL